MSFADVLKKRAEETGQKVIEAEKPVVEKAENKSAFAAALQQRKATKDPNQIVVEFDTGAIPVWSFSSLKDYEQCPYRVYLAKIEKKPQKQSDAASRGEAIHQMAEDFVRNGTGEVPKELSKFDIAFRDLQQLFADGKVIMEENWGIRKDWSPCEWKDPDIWGRAKLDVFIRESETAGKIVDHKSGKKFGNELKHGDQGLSYALHAFHRYPEIETFKVEFWYLDHAETLERLFTRRQLGILLPRYHKRAQDMTTAKVFPAKPNCNNCRWCAYGNGKFGTGDCEFAEK